ncbi:MAG: hypothetical protein Q8O00_10980 [Holophaga sp.]|nr:hypothetical protein [Holophaga sp.]
MEPGTFTVRTRDGREFSGLTLSSLEVALAQRIFSSEDSARPEGEAESWVSLGQLLGGSRSELQETNPGASLASPGIALDLDVRPLRPRPVMVSPEQSLPAEPAFRFNQPSDFAQDEEGPVRFRLQIAGGFLLLSGILGMAAYALGRHGIGDSIVMLVNTGLGIALLMNLPQIRKWAVGWVMAGWGLLWGAGILSGGCFGFVLLGLISGLMYGGPVCLLWGEDCPRSRFWTGVTLMGILLLLGVIGIILVAVAGAALLQRMSF